MEQKHPCISSNAQTLLDAGCSTQFIKRYEESETNPIKRFQMLYEHREILLREIHSDQKKLDCLDYFIQIEKKREEK